MKQTSIRLLTASWKGQRRLFELARASGVSYSYASRLAKELQVKGLLERRKQVFSTGSTSKAILLRELSHRFDLYRLLGGQNEKVLLAMKTVSPLHLLVSETGLSYETIRRSLNQLMEIGAVSKTEGGYRVTDADLALFLQLERREESYSRVESYAEILWSKGDVILKVVPRGRNANGVLTAFSRFSLFNVEVEPHGDYYIQPSAEIGVEEAFMHALRTAKAMDETTLCGIFYLKNKLRLREERLRALARRFDLEMRLAELQEYLRTGEAPSESDLFPPWHEFMNKAEVYHLRLEPGAASIKPEDVLREVGKRLAGTVDVYLLGGENLRLKGLKTSTKDIDMVVEDEKQFQLLVAAMRGLGYQPLATESYSLDDRRANVSIILVSEGLPRIDVWTRKIAGKLVLLPEMRRRVEEKDYGGLRLYLMSNEDIFLLKSVADRAIDLPDLQKLAESPRFKWSRVLETLLSEERATDRHFCLALVKVLDTLLETRSIKTPIHQKLLNHALEYLLPLVLREGSKSLHEIAEQVESQMPSYQLRNRLESLARRGVVKKEKDAKGVKYRLASS